jgi:hypothetical protein
MRSVPSKSTKSVAKQRSGKHSSTRVGDGVFRGVLAKELSLKQMALRFSSEFSLESSSCEDFMCDYKTIHV